jgi:hypothetical protein
MKKLKKILCCNNILWTKQFLLILNYFSAKVLLTSFRHGVIPPPLCGQTLQAPLPVNGIIFAPCKKIKSSVINKEEYTEINSNALCTILSDGSMIVFVESSSTNCHVQLTACKLSGENAGDLHHWLWMKEDLFLCCRTHGTVSYLMEISLDVNAGKMSIRQDM